MREIVLANLDKTRPVLVLTRERARGAMTKVTVAPITTTIKGLSSELPLGLRNGLDQDCVASMDNITTLPTRCLGRTIGYLTADQEQVLAQALILAFDLDLPLGNHF
ncbi:mRNA interferase MazF3 [Actinomyces bovis]|uniref:mRNA interferase MazF3 n=1 Tax=Actinomyces bovis TaxID=1658 RepID=A0ABY1VNK9_9ACTO|nr:type II toxin-antitoxin system PemK/MazF family toxin [Actinomyces bovis]SPT53408.1 mRNA interferase MazF3 [Actinomyces bovis]VEG52832.1 mRNA interferase MazF3 [Actinomyces israelii]